MVALLVLNAMSCQESVPKWFSPVFLKCLKHYSETLLLFSFGILYLRKNMFRHSRPPWHNDTFWQHISRRIFKTKKLWLVQIKNSLDDKDPRARKKMSVREPVSWQVPHSFEYHKNSKWVWRAYRHPARLAAVPPPNPPHFVLLSAEIEWQSPAEIKWKKHKYTWESNNCKRKWIFEKPLGGHLQHLAIWKNKLS